MVIGKHVLTHPRKHWKGEIQIDSTLSLQMHQSWIWLLILCGNDAFKSHCGDILTVNKIVRQASSVKTCWKSKLPHSRRYVILRNWQNGHTPWEFLCCYTCNFVDGVDEDLEIRENMVTEGGNVNISATARHLLNKPHHIPYLNRLRKQTKSAQTLYPQFFPNFITQIYNSLLT